ncbi:MAG TPA: LytTR family DNA-binding domain-containing protein, partial [Hanamia sp.]|nr:LytTR family DNA-binding domain-containing protein [Hanamia sp.]
WNKMSDKLKCVIIDDEPIACEIIENFVKELNYLELVAVCEDAFEALDILQNNPIDLLFSDIQMPKINGLELVSSLPSSPVIIFITAHDTFAVNSFDLAVADYLLKPVSFDRFLKAVNKAKLQIDLRKSASLPNSENKAAEFIFIKANNKLNKVEYKDILYIESIKDYVKIFTKETYLLTYSSMKAIEEKLPSNHFIRIHNSFLVQISAIKALMGNTAELINGVSLPISKSRKNELFAALQINPR